MPDLDSTALAAVESHFARADFIFLDIDGDPLRVTTFGANVTFGASETGDADLDGFTFLAFGGQLLNVGDVSNADTGSDTLDITLQGIVSMDPTLLADIGDKTKWQGRIIRTWFRLYDPTGVTQQGAIVTDYTGYMSKVAFSAKPDSQTIVLSAENYLSFTTQASNRSYLNQSDYDAADISASATMASANGARPGAGTHPISAAVPFIGPIMYAIKHGAFKQ